MSPKIICIFHFRHIAPLTEMFWRWRFPDVRMVLRNFISLFGFIQLNNFSQSVVGQNPSSIWKLERKYNIQFIADNNSLHNLNFWMYSFEENELIIWIDKPLIQMHNARGANSNIQMNQTHFKPLMQTNVIETNPTNYNLIKTRPRHQSYS